MSTKIRKLLKSGPYLLNRHYNPQTGDYFHVISIDRDAYSRSNTDFNILKAHFCAGTRCGLLEWYFKDRNEPTELISLAILKGLV